MENNLNIALVTPYPPSKTTLNEYGYYLAKHLSEKPELEQLFLLTEETEEAYEPENGKMSFFPCWKFNSLKNPFRILSQIRQLKPDAVVINLQFLLFGDKKVAAALGLMLPVLLKLFGIKSIVLMHNILEEVDLKNAGISNSKIMRFIYNMIGNFLTRCILMADIVGVTIEKYVDVLTEKYKKSNIVLFPHGTFESPAMPDFSVKEGRKKILAFGKFGTYKKVEILIEAFDKLQQKGIEDMELVIAGTDSPNVKGYLEDVAEKYQNVNNIVFTGYVPENEVSTVFEESSMVVFPYTSTTGSSGVLHQTGSYGKPAILPNLGDLGRLVEEEGYAGEYFEPESSESLSNAIEKLMTDVPYRRQIAEQNYEAASALSLSDITDWYLIHISNLLNS